MRLLTIISIASLAVAPAVLALAGPPVPVGRTSDCTQECSHDRPSERRTPVQLVQHVALQPAPGNKFPLPAPNAQQPAHKAGTLAIRAVQGTPGADPVGPVQVEIELYHRGSHIDTIEIELDEHGVALVEDIPVAMGFQPLVKVAYSGVTYQKAGEVMDATRPHQMIEVVCYELTQDPPPWKVRMRHVMVTLAPDGVEVTEVLVVENPTDRTWIGRPRAGAGQGEGKAVTTIFPVPAGALQVTLGRGFHEWCCTTQAENRLENHIPLTPGTTEMIFGYYLPAQRGIITLEIASLVDVDHLMLIVPDSLGTESYSGLSAAGADKIGDHGVRLYTATSVKGSAGSSSAPRIVLGGLGGGSSLASGTLAKLIAGFGGAAILIIAGVLVFSRSQKAPATPLPAAAN